MMYQGMEIIAKDGRVFTFREADGYMISGGYVDIFDKAGRHLCILKEDYLNYIGRIEMEETKTSDA